MTLKRDTKFKEKLTCGVRHDMSNLVNFHATTQKSENFFPIGSFIPNYTRFEIQKYRGVIFHDTEQLCKIWIKPDFVVSKMAWRLGRTFIRALESLKTFTLMGSFFPKNIMFQLENFIGIMSHDTEEWPEEKLILEKYAFFVWCSRFEVVKGRCS